MRRRASPASRTLSSSVRMARAKASLEAGLLCAPGVPVDLAARNPADTDGFGKKEALAKLAKDQAKLDALQQLLYAERKRRVLLVLQGMDTSGKDGTIRHVMR